ncbi:electron transport complex subunit RsxC [Shewanella surugensis]|uniref:Ion-translocating oxidoreductase complex subunit C n=1 Tax=Shewanella surugensis TaxID=212020 RepID=A0ABT0LFH1_9GAMM|nr:electron transport complex subunit RsxC [Shewanella surugensis]MCL1126457.1 electron transport complex subunit RsxC [Shewanella surugensis]
MLSLLEQIDSGTLWQSPGGIHPPQIKSLSNTRPIARLPLAQEYVIPVPQLGEQAILAVNIGDLVKKGTPLTQGQSATYLAVHSPTSGILVAVEERASNHASGLPVLSCIIQADGLDTWSLLDSHQDFQPLSNAEMLTRIQAAGIAGLGGAAFPTHIKLNPVSDIELLIINGIECEPYITSDDRLMREYSHDILTGVSIIQQLIGPKRIIFAVEDNKPDAIKAIKKALKRHPINSAQIRVTAVPTKYPSGGEKQLIQMLTGQEVPSGAIPAQLGMLVQNVGTVFAIKEAVLDGKPLIERVVTITGERATTPGNYWLPIGTPIEHVLSLSQTPKKPPQHIIIGGPMMGYILPQASAPIIKGTNCLLLPSDNEMLVEQQEKPCIRCGECAQVCPALLLPQQLFWHAQAKEYDKAASYNLQDCIECGCCSYVCPSDIPLVEYYRVAKSALREQSKDKQEADLAKQRFDARTQRLEEEKTAREAKQQQAASRRKANVTNKDNDVIAAAMARIKAKKDSSPSTQEITAENTAIAHTELAQKTDKKAQIAAALARAKAKKAQMATALNTDITSPEKAQLNANEGAITHIPVTDSPIVDKKAKIAAAVARAKAKKAQMATAQNTDITSPEKTQLNASEGSIAHIPVIDSPIVDKKAKIAAAVAKAKAKKSQMATALNTDITSPEKPQLNASEGSQRSITQTPVIDSPIVDKKAKVAAAVARAKAKKAQTTAAMQPQDRVTTENQTESSSEQTPVTDSLSIERPVLDKKAKIAAAVAKAKAKKAQAQQENKD